jgi:hypothetical protein
MGRLGAGDGGGGGLELGVAVLDEVSFELFDDGPGGVTVGELEGNALADGVDGEVGGMLAGIVADDAKGLAQALFVGGGIAGVVEADLEGE